MNCLSNEEIQKYIDREISTDEIRAFDEHISVCPQCRNLYNIYKDELNKLMNLLSKVEVTEAEIPIPEFRNIGASHNRLIRYFAVAACIIVLFGATWFYQTQEEKKQSILKARLETEQLLYHSDSNKIWNKKEPIITITNNEGEIIYTSFED